MTEEKIHTLTLSNGIRVIHFEDDGPVAYCGMVVNTGTRDELPDQHGYAHLIEHMLFKGTQKRNASQIINRLEAVGGELNAFTSKEDTTVYAISLLEDLPRAVELVADVVLHSTFAEEELVKEKEVVMDEIDLYLDNPSESIIDDFEDELFAGYPIGRNILGTQASLRAAHQSGLRAFYDRCYTTDQMVFFVMGACSFVKVQKWAQQYLEPAVRSIRSYQREVPTLYTPHELEVDKQTSQVHCLIGTRAMTAYDESRYAFLLLNNIVGGVGSNSRLNMALREKKGWVYQVESQYTPYSDTGLWSVYLGTDHEDLKKVLRATRIELDKMMQKPLSEVQLVKAKKQLLSQLAIASENKENWVLNAAKQFSLHGKIGSKAQWMEHMNAVKASDVQDLAQRYFAADQQLRLCYL